LIKITVIITTYNLENLISKCLKELFSQTFIDFEIIIIDDCSTDNTKNIINEFIIKYPERIQTIYLEKNQGYASKLRNIVIDSGKIKGEYIIFLDGDDSLENNFLENLYKLANETNSDLSICAYDRVILETGYVLCKEMQGFPKILNIPPENDILSFVNGALWNKLIKTSIIGDIRDPDFRVGDDTCFSLKLYKNCKLIAFTDEILIHYQVRRDSVINTIELENVYSLADEFFNIYNNCNDKYLKYSIGLSAFIHIGISMPIRIKNNRNISIKKHLIWTYNYFENKYIFFKNNIFFKLKSLKKHGIKGFGLWMCFCLYKIKLFGIFISLYNVYTILLKKEIKF